MEVTQKSTDGRMDKQNVVYAYNKIYSALKMEEILSHATTWMNLEDIMLGEIHQAQKDKDRMILLT